MHPPLRTIRAALVVAAMLLFVPGVHAGDSEHHVRFRLTGPAIDGVVPHGRFQSFGHDDSGWFLLVVEDVKLPGAKLEVAIDGSDVGSIEIDERGYGSLAVRPSDDEEVPHVRQTSRVEVRDEESGDLVLVGPTVGPRRSLMMARLVGPPIGGRKPQGLAVYRTGEWGNWRDLLVVVQNVDPPGAKLGVRVDGRLIGTFDVSNGRRATFRIDTGDGAVPEMTRASVLLITDEGDGSTILANQAWRRRYR